MELEFWSRVQEDPPTNISRAVHGVLAGWKGDRLAGDARIADAETLARTDWPSTIRAITRWVRERFASETTYPRAVERWHNLASHLKGRDYDTGGAFFLAFEQELMTTKAAQRQQGIPEASQGEVTAMMMLALPEAVRANIREREPLVDTRRPGTCTDAQSNASGPLSTQADQKSTWP